MTKYKFLSGDKRTKQAIDDLYFKLKDKPVIKGGNSKLEQLLVAEYLLYTIRHFFGDPEDPNRPRGPATHNSFDRWVDLQTENPWVYDDKSYNEET